LIGITVSKIRLALLYRHLRFKYALKENSHVYLH
jgi:hypothetical protein